MKRLLTAFVPLGILTGLAIATQMLVLAGTPTVRAAVPVPASIVHAQQVGSPEYLEPISIVLLSLTLLSWATFLRRSRMKLHLGSAENAPEINSFVIDNPRRSADHTPVRPARLSSPAPSDSLVVS